MTDAHADLPRRQFLHLLAAAGAGSALALTSRAHPPTAAPGGSAPEAGDATVPVREFGKTGVKVSMLGLGGMFDIPSNQVVLRTALKHGVTYWDTADCYGGGKSEEGIGKFFERNPEERKRVFLVTKSDEKRDLDGITRLLNRSLERMKTDYVDLYFLHGIPKTDVLTPDVRAWADRMKKEGKIRFFGFSTHANMETCLTEAAKLGWIDGIMLTYNYRLMHTDGMRAAVAAAHGAGIGLTAMKTQGGGPVKTDSETELEMAGRLLQRGFTEGQAKLKAVWGEERIACVCSQMPNMSLLTANIAAALDRNALARAELDLLRLHDRETHAAYCAGCTRLCESAVGQAVPIGDVMRGLMYAGYGDDDQARTVFRALPETVRRVLTAADYSAAERCCPRNLPIGALMRTAAERLA